MPKSTLARLKEWTLGFTILLCAAPAWASAATDTVAGADQLVAEAVPAKPANSELHDAEARMARQGHELLSTLLCQFQLVDTLTFYADVCVFMFKDDGSGQPPRAGESACGSIFFTASADRYRYTSEIPHEQYPGLQTDVAYDGKTFQLLLSNGTLIRSSEHADTLLPVIPNPLFELLQAFYPMSDHNATNELHWTHLRHNSQTGLLTAAAHAQARRSGQDDCVLTIPGGLLRGEPYAHQLYFENSVKPRLTRIDRVSSSGVLSRVEFSQHRQLEACGARGWWPHAIRMTAFDEHHDVVALVEYQIRALVVNGPVSEETLTIPVASARRVWVESSP